MSECNDEKKRDSWRRQWRCWNNANDTNIAKWQHAVDQLLSGPCTDAIDYSCKESSSIMHYTQAVAEAVYRYIPPGQVLWSKESRHVQGKIQLCEKVVALFNWSKSMRIEERGTQVLGLHGIPGVGKSTLGKILCDFYSAEFGGRVCYVELGPPIPQLAQSNDVRVHRQKRILRELLEAGAELVEWRVRDLDQADAYLDFYLGMASKRVFLVVDNIHDSPRSFEEARDLFVRKAPLPRGSKVLLLARSRHTLRRLLQHPDSTLSNNVLEFPLCTLSNVCDQIFCAALKSVHSVGAMETDDIAESGSNPSVVIEGFQDFFPAFCRSCHPLIIESMAVFAQSKGPRVWDLALGTESVSEFSEPYGLKEQPPTYLSALKRNTRIHELVKAGLLNKVFENLQKSYTLFTLMEQKFFLDVALFMPSTNIHRLWRLHDSPDEIFSSTSRFLRKLRDEAFLTVKGREVEMPAICRCFAEHVVRRGDWSAEMMYMAREKVEWACLRGTFEEASISDSLQRIALESCQFVQGPDDSSDCLLLDLSGCSRLSVLRLWGNMSDRRVEVRLGRCSMLESLEVLWNTCPIIVTGDSPPLVRCFKGEYSGMVSWSTGSNAGSYPESNIAEASQDLEVLEVFMAGQLEINSLRHLEQFVNLYILRLHSKASYDLISTSGYVSRSGTWRVPEGVLHLSCWTRLEELVLQGLENLDKLGGLDMLRSLRVLHLSDLDRLRHLNVTELGKLEECHVIDCRVLWEIELPVGSRLKHCCIYRCGNLSRIVVKEAGKAAAFCNEEVAVYSDKKEDDKEHNSDEEAAKSEQKQLEDDEENGGETRWWLHYDASMWRWSTSYIGRLLYGPDFLRRTAREQETDQQQHWVRCFRFETSTEPDDNLVPTFTLDEAISNHKLKVRDCPSLHGIVGLIEKLKGIRVFEFSQRKDTSADNLIYVLGDLNMEIRGLVEISEFSFERVGAGDLAQLLSLQVVEISFYLSTQHLVEVLHGCAPALKKLAIRSCRACKKCGCNRMVPDFSLLQHLQELHYVDCCCVRDLSSLASLRHLTALNLEGCTNVETWPPFASMSTLTSLNLTNTSWRGPHPLSPVVK